jgi:Fe-S cluster biogenesis protein NfuA
MFIQTETTPNPATLKFVPGRPVMSEGTLEIRDAKGAERSPLARALFEIDGVCGVFYGPDFISVSKDRGEWPHLKPAILGLIMEHYLTDQPLIEPDAAGALGADGTGDEFFDPGDAETVATIKELLETRVRPAVAGDGGDITFRGFRDGTVFLAMRGSCAGCPSSTATLKHGIQNLLCHFLPSVRAVEQI